MKKLLRGILLIINLVFAVALLLSTMAGVVAPSKFEGISYLSYGYFLLLMANVVFIVIWLCMSRWEFLLSVATILLRVSFVPLFFQIGGTTEAEATDETLRVMTFNTHGFKGLDSDTLMTADSGAAIFLTIVDDEQPDVLCLQEYFSAPHVRVADSLEARGYRYHYGVHGENSNAPTILFSKCKIENVCNMDTASKFYVDLSKNGKMVRVCCVHLDSYQLIEKDWEGFEKLYHAQPDSNTHNMLRKFAETTRQHEKEWKDDLQPLIERTRMPLIVAGDFNDTPASYIYQQISEYMEDPYVEQGRGFATTYHGPYPAFRIDYILHSEELEALSYKRVKTNISDHYPVVVTFQLD